MRIGRTIRVNYRLRDCRSRRLGAATHRCNGTGVKDCAAVLCSYFGTSRRSVVCCWNSWSPSTTSRARLPKGHRHPPAVNGSDRLTGYMR
jgi:hypothetical protein